MYQAYLSATNYHLLAQPVAGTIVRAFRADGPDHSEADSERGAAVEPELAVTSGRCRDRAIILMQADNRVIGLTAIMPDGMSEGIVVRHQVLPGRPGKVQRLRQLPIRASTSATCLVFRPEVVAVRVTRHPQPHDPDAPLVLACSKLATARTG